MSWDDPHAWRASYDAWKTDMLDSYSYGDGPSMESVRELDDEMRDLVERDAPSGYVLVPVEPTEGMLAAGMDSLAQSTGEPLSFIVRDVLFAYRAMLAALRMPAKVAPLTEKHEAEARTAYRAKVDAGWSEET